MAGTGTMVWYGMVWYGMRNKIAKILSYYVLVWYGMVW